MAFKTLPLGTQQEKNLKAEEELRRQQKERAEMEKIRQAEERKRFVFLSGERKSLLFVLGRCTQI